MTEQSGPREAVSLKRAAYLLDVHEDTIRRWWKAGTIEVVRIGAKLLRVPRSEIARLRKRKKSSGVDDFRPHTSA